MAPSRFFALLRESVLYLNWVYTVTHQTTHILPPAGAQNALDESHKKPSAQQAARRTGVLARCQRAHGARLGRWRSRKDRQWPSAGVSGDRDLTLRADDLTSLGTTQPDSLSHNPTQPPTTQPNRPQPNPTQKARFSCWALGPLPHKLELHRSGDPGDH